MATFRQKRAAKLLIENPGMHVTEAMRRVGYSKNTANTPQQLTDTKGWKELMAEYLPDESLAAKHQELLNAKRTVSARITNKEAGIDTDDFIEVEDYQTQVKALDISYKLKGKYAPEKHEHSGEIVIPILGGLSVHGNNSNSENTPVTEED